MAEANKSVPRWIIVSTAILGLIAAILTVGVKVYELRKARLDSVAKDQTPATISAPPHGAVVASTPSIARTTPIPSRLTNASKPAGTFPSTIQGASKRTSPPAPANAIDLLALIDPSKDAYEPGWAKTSDSPTVLSSPAQTTNRHGRYGEIMRIPYKPVPAAYDLTFEVTRRSAGMSLNLGFMVGGHQSMVMIDGTGLDGGRTALEEVDGKSGHNNPTTHRGKLLHINEPRHCKLSVDDGCVQFYCDDRKIIDWQGEGKRLTLFQGWRIDQEDIMFIGVQARFDISRLLLIPRP